MPLGEPRFPSRFDAKGRPLNDLGWGFHYPENIVKIGFREWQASGFIKYPDPDEIMARDPAWMEDMWIAYEIVMHKKPENNLPDAGDNAFRF